MVNVNCSGGQDRDTTTSESYPHIPPPKTKNCYLTDENTSDSVFDRDKCGADDGACRGKGGIISCRHDDYGGYCKTGGKIYVATGLEFTELDSDDLLDRYKSSSSDTDTRIERALGDQERKMTNKIRELQIMGRDPIQSKTEKKSDDNNDNNDNNEVHDSISSMLFNFGMGSLIILLILSITIFTLIHKKII